MRSLTLTLAALALLAGGAALTKLSRTAHSAPAPKPPELLAAPADWPWWRGPTREGKSRDRHPVVSWSPKKNVVWKASVPGRGHSSPIVCGDQVFLTTADEAAQRQIVLSYSRKTGQPLWSVVANEGGFAPKHAKNSHASATPACDGERVFSAFISHDALHVTAVSLDGKLLWNKRVASFKSENGYGASPVLHGSLVIVNGDNLEECFVAALSRRTGKIVWRADRKTSGQHASYATPALGTIAGKPQLILTGLREVTSYDPATGVLLWSCAGAPEVTACTAAFSDSLVFASGTFPDKTLLAIRANGTGDVTATHLVWRAAKGASYVPSPLYHDGCLYLVNDTGVATCFDSRTGKPLWCSRLEGSFSASPVLVGELLFAASESGRTYVLRAGRKFEVVARNDLEAPVLASPAICGGQILIRTDEHLYCIGDRSGG